MKSKTVVVIGNGMVGHKFCERMAELDPEGHYRIVTFCEEPRPAYDRVQLTSFFSGKTADDLSLADIEWYKQRGIELFIGDCAEVIDRDEQVVRSAKGREIAYDHVVLATGSRPFIPPIPGIEKAGVFAYRTIEDLVSIRDYASKVKSAAVIGRGLLGLEAAKATADMGLDTAVLEYGDRLMSRQLDPQGGSMLRTKIEALGVKVMLGRDTREVLGEQCVEGLRFSDGEELETSMVIVSAGIRPRDDLAKSAGLFTHDRGGILVDDQLRTSDPNIFAIGECAVVGGMVYGIVAPCYDMADIVASNLTEGKRRFEAADLSTKLKLMGVDVASVGNPFPVSKKQQTLVYEDLRAGIYKKLVFDEEGATLQGAILVGDAEPYGRLLMMFREGMPVPEHPEELLFGERSGHAAAELELPDSAQVCSCNNVSVGDLRKSIRENDFTGIDEVKIQTKAGTGCGGCIPLVTQIVNRELSAAGVKVKSDLCPHFSYQRAELFEIARIKKIRTFDELLAQAGNGGDGCDVCKPTVASILASLWNEHVVSEEHATLQDTNDRFLANIQRGGTYSVVPRVPGGEITPEQLIVLGEVAKKYDLYTKLTGGQRVDLFGARVDQLPDIWKELIDAGFESGHAYGKALRTIKSCVGSTWCRYGVGDAVGLAIRLEKRYRGIRSPHKIKSAVSGCVRECAEAQSKDFGVIATAIGWNLYVCWNGGAKARHAGLLASDLDEETLVRVIDCFLMYYIRTAERLQRTSTWLETLEGGVEFLRQVVVEDSLGLATELEAEMEQLVDTYRCEWTEVVENPERIAQFKQFANVEDTADTLGFVRERGQKRPADWPEPQPQVPIQIEESTNWVELAKTSDFPKDGGRAIQYGAVQIAVFNFSHRDAWYAVQNQCPHMMEMVLARGIVGDLDGVPMVACPTHKKTFSLENGKGLSDSSYSINAFPVKVEGETVFVKLPSLDRLEQLMSCNKPDAA